MKRTIAIITIVGGMSVGLVLACGSDSGNEEGTGIPGRGTSSGTNGEGGTSSSGSTSGGMIDCTNRAKVSDTPACDTCAKAKCCTQIDECDQNPDCQAAQDCIAACAEGDQICGLTCLLSHEEGSNILQKLASCTQTKCKAECPQAQAPDASDDGPF